MVAASRPHVTTPQWCGLRCHSSDEDGVKGEKEKIKRRKHEMRNEEKKEEDGK